MEICLSFYQLKFVEQRKVICYIRICQILHLAAADEKFKGREHLWGPVPPRHYDCYRREKIEETFKIINFFKVGAIK